ncbi:CHASE3 domain-containing protein [Xanthocytophaga agilis]|uniref:histidine kinase n=1 Tax=Xanthocytophaga agilis TaxID=3048010 RepID=A0AAE3R9F3_9BACT|nr:ATP-binding protein [Xanthocytophaga agilis]MDJ1503197.1 CHASE3 domain-containing protein [Xanthocytophaga agilis]
MMRYSKPIVHTAFIISTLVLAWIGFSIYQNHKVALEKAAQVFHSNRIIYTAEKVLSLLNRAENGQREYVVSNDSIDLQPYYRSIDSVGGYIDSLYYLTNSNTHHRLLIDSLKKNASVKIDLMQYAILLKNNNNLSGLESLYKSPQNRAAMNNIQHVLQEVIAEERNHLTLRNREYVSSVHRTTQAIYWVLGSYLLMISGSFILIQNKFRNKDYYEGKLVTLSAELKQKDEELHSNNRELMANSNELTAIYGQLNKIKNEFANISLSRMAKIRRINNLLVAEAHKREKITDDLRKSESRFKAALNKAPIVVFNQDIHLRYTWIYDNTNLSQYHFSDSLGKTDTEIFPVKEAEQLTAIKQHVLETGEGTAQEINLSFGRKKVYLLLTIEPTFDKNQKIKGITCAGYDITDQKKTEDVLRHTLKELKKRNHELDNYVYKVSHDLRAPLVSILGLINLTKMDDNPDTLRNYLSLIENRVSKLDDFIKSVLNHSRTLNSEIIIKPIDFEKIIHDCADELRYLPNLERLHIEVNVDKEVEFHSDELRIGIILKNFISNAAKYLNPHVDSNFLRFQIIVTEQQAKIIIEDNGMGIEEQYIARIFDMFFRATPKSDGSGLGLYIVKQTIERLEGSVSVESEIGKGTTFRLLMPNFKVQ